MKGTKLRIGLDVDDVLMECIPFICRYLNEKKGMYPPITPDEFSAWGILTPRTQEAYKCFTEAWLYETQPAIKGAQELVRKLCKIAEVFIISAVAPEFMSARAKRIMELFPEIPKDNIILGSRKDIVDIDILFDDGAHNILSSKAKFPVLMRQPWNKDVSGRLTANNFEDFLKIVETIRQSYTESTSKYNCVCLVGPSGSGKHEIAADLGSKGCITVKSYTTGDNDKHIKVSEEQFADMMSKGLFFEETYFAGIRYGLSWESLNKAFEAGSVPVIVTDICGAMTIRRTANPLVVYCQSTDQQMLTNILRKGESEETTVSRILSLQAEKANESLCDISVAGLTPAQASDVIARELAS